MPECATDGCRQPAEMAVTFTGPKEIVNYCPHCAWHNFRSNSNAKKITKGVDDT